MWKKFPTEKCLFINKSSFCVDRRTSELCSEFNHLSHYGTGYKMWETWLCSLIGLVIPADALRAAGVQWKYYTYREWKTVKPGKQGKGGTFDWPSGRKQETIAMQIFRSASKVTKIRNYIGSISVEREWIC